MAEPPYVTGGLSMFWGYVQAALKGEDRHQDMELRRFIRSYQRRALFVGKARATVEFEAAQAGNFAK
jgi:hypothetical protein